jgi:tetratricopeptide (TPR) repeat protein
MMRRLMIPLALVSTLGSVLGPTLAQAQELEKILAQPAATQQSRNSVYMADVLRGILRTPTPEQNHLLRLLEESNWTESLIQFKKAFPNSNSAMNEDIKATKAWLEFKNGLTVTALENLFQIKEPKKIHFQILNQWREAASPSHPAWQVAKIEWKKDWTEIFGVITEVRVKSADQSLPESIQALNELAMLAPADSRERALLDWNMAIHYGTKDDTKKAAVIISSLMKAKNNPIPEDLLNLTAARLLYQSAYFEAAEKYYDKIAKGSDYYPQAQEEKAWSFLKRRQPQDALAVTQSLVHKMFSGQIGPETWFVRAMAQLKVCDYGSALETLKEFPKEFKDRSIGLEKISKDARGPEIEMALAKMKNGGLFLAEMAQISKNLPRSMIRDERLRQMVKTMDILNQEAHTATQILAETHITGVQGEYEALKSNFEQRSERVKAQALNRVQMLAQQEVTETKNILNKLHIVEAEVIQRVESSMKLSEASDHEIRNGNTGSQSKDVLRFPTGGEIWLDELTNYKVDIKKGCQARRTP